MKKITFILFYVLCLSGISFAQQFTIKKGSELIYGVRSGNNNYTLTVKVKSIDTLTFVFDMSAPANKKGIVTIPPGAMDTATRLVNYFANGEMKLTDATAIWVSNTIYKLACEPGIKPTIKIRIDTARQYTVFGMLVPQMEDLIINGKVVKMKVTEMVEAYWDEKLQDRVEGKRITILQNSKNPLIISMNIGFEVALKEAKKVDLVE